MLGVAGVNTRPLLDVACLGVAGNWSPALRRAVLTSPPVLDRRRLGDNAAVRGWKRGVLFLAWTYMVVPDGQGGVRWRPPYAQGWSREERVIPLFLDSNAYSRWTGRSVSWDTLELYCRAIDFIQPDGYMAWDVIGDNQASLRNYQTMVAWGYQPIPVWQMREAWDPRADDVIRDRTGRLTPEERVAIANGRRAARDPVLQYYCSRARLVAIGGMAQGPCPVRVRHLYLRELCRAYPDHQFWALAQANATVINGLGQHGLLRQVWTDGTWWIHHARTEQFVVLEDGLLRNIRLRGQARSFFTLAEMAAASIRALLSAYNEDWVWPEPAPIPDPEDVDGMLQLSQRIRQQTIWDLAAAGGAEMEEAS